MQIDMHYHGTYALAKAAGIPASDAATIAYAAQFVDDSTRYDSGMHSDGGLLYGITTSHHPAQSLIDNVSDHKDDNAEQRRIWVPFHFFPGGEGGSFHEKLICTKNGRLVNEMLDNHLEHGVKKVFALELIGIAAHVYMDTFSHYGFSGMSSDFNAVKAGSVVCLSHTKRDVLETLKGKFESFTGVLAGAGSDNLGHAGAATYPDKPFLHWAFEFILPRPGNGTRSDRNNYETYLDGCEKLHNFFCRFARARYAEAGASVKAFAEIKNDIMAILDCAGGKEERATQWAISPLATGSPTYDPRLWENEKRTMFAAMATSAAGINTNAYRFHQAAAYHRFYVLKDLLPAHGIAVY